MGLSGSKSMAYEYYIDAAVNCVFIRHFDTFEIGEGAGVLDEILKDPTYRKGMNFLRDISQTSLATRMGDKSFIKEGRRLSKEYDIRLENGRIAWVLSSSTDYAMVHRWTVTSRSSGAVERKPLRDIEKARLWLGIPDDYKIKFPD